MAERPIVKHEQQAAVPLNVEEKMTFKDEEEKIVLLYKTAEVPARLMANIVAIYGALHKLLRELGERDLASTMDLSTAARFNGTFFSIGIQGHLTAYVKYILANAMHDIRPSETSTRWKAKYQGGLLGDADKCAEARRDVEEVGRQHGKDSRISNGRKTYIKRKLECCTEIINSFDAMNRAVYDAAYLALTTELEEGYQGDDDQLIANRMTRMVNDCVMNGFSHSWRLVRAALPSVEVIVSHLARFAGESEFPERVFKVYRAMYRSIHDATKLSITASDEYALIETTNNRDHLRSTCKVDSSIENAFGLFRGLVTCWFDIVRSQRTPIKGDGSASNMFNYAQERFSQRDRALYFNVTDENPLFPDSATVRPATNVSSGFVPRIANLCQSNIVSGMLLNCLKPRVR